MKRIGLLTGLLLAGMLLADSCSTTKMLAENEARLAENKISIVNEPQRTARYNASSLQPYVKQKANSTILGMVNPFVYVWNWQNGNDGGWDRFCRKLGEEPVAFDERLVDDSVTLAS